MKTISKEKLLENMKYVILHFKVYGELRFAEKEIDNEEDLKKELKAVAKSYKITGKTIDNLFKSITPVEVKKYKAKEKAKEKKETNKKKINELTNRVNELEKKLHKEVNSRREKERQVNELTEQLVGYEELITMIDEVLTHNHLPTTDEMITSFKRRAERILKLDIRR